MPHTRCHSQHYCPDKQQATHSIELHTHNRIPYCLQVDLSSFSPQKLECNLTAWDQITVADILVRVRAGSYTWVGFGHLSACLTLGCCLGVAGRLAARQMQCLQQWLKPSSTGRLRSCSHRNHRCCWRARATWMPHVCSHPEQQQLHWL